METEHSRLLIAPVEDELSKRCFTFSVFTQPRPKADFPNPAEPFALQVRLARTSPVACSPLLAGIRRRRRRIASVAELRAAAHADGDRQIEIGAQGPGPDRTEERDINDVGQHLAP